MSSALLTVKGLTKAFRSHWTYAKRPALNGVSFEIPEGSIFGFLGHNGAGKTTTIKCILGLISRDDGSVDLLGEDPASASVRKLIGYLPELPYFYDHLSVEETLEYLGGLALKNLSGKELDVKVSETLSLVGLSERKRSRVRTLSKGLQQRLGLAQAIINKPKLLLLDEPFSGLDPVGRAEFKTIIRNLNASGTTILISSHILPDVQALCNRVTILVKGETKKSFSLEERGTLFGEKRQLQLLIETGKSLPENLKDASKISSERISNIGEEFILTFEDEKEAVNALELAVVAEKNGVLKIREFRREARSLEEIFLDVTEGKI